MVLGTQTEVYPLLHMNARLAVSLGPDASDAVPGSFLTKCGMDIQFTATLHCRAL